MTQRYRDVLDYEIGARIVVEFETQRRDIVDYAVVLTIDGDDGKAATVRVYDGAHGINEMHRFDRHGGKEAGETVHAGTLGEGMRAAIVAVRTGHEEMIEAWRLT